MREIINSVKWVSAWLSFQAVGLGWYEISHIYWKSGKKWEISYLSPFLTFTSIFNRWLVRVSYGVITSAPLFTFLVIFFSLALKGYFPYVMYNTLALLLLSILRGGGEFWNVGGSSLTQPYANLYSNFPKCPLRYSLAQANVFAIFTVSTVSVIDFWQCIGGQSFLSRLRAENVCSEVTDVTGIVKHISKSVFRHQNVRGGLCPPKILFGVGATAFAPYSAAYDTTFPKLYMTCNSITCSRLFVSFNFWYYKKNIQK